MMALLLFLLPRYGHSPVLLNAGRVHEFCLFFSFLMYQVAPWRTVHTRLRVCVFCLPTVTAIIVDYSIQYNAFERWNIGIKTTGMYVY